MKILTIAVCGALVGLFPSDARSENIVRQTQLSSGVQYDFITGNDQGTAQSSLPIEEGGASYELFARGSAWDTNLYFLDRKIVGFYLPKSEIILETEDQTHEWAGANGVRRTRADRPFSVAIRVWGLTPNDPEAPDAAKKTLYTHTAQNYDDTYTPNGNAEYTLASYYMGNSNPEITPVYTQLTPASPTKAMGIERFTVSTLKDETVRQTSIVDEKMLIVWPISEAFIEGMEPGAKIRDNLPKIIVRYKDLYPASLSYMQIYKGPENLGTVGTLIPSTQRWHNTTVPQNEVISLENWENLIPEDGTYTLEILSCTPFDNWQPERLSSVTFSVNRKIKLNGQVTTSEK